MPQVDPTTLSGERLIRLDEMSEAIRSDAAPGVVAAACHKESARKHGKPQGVVSDDQPKPVRDRLGALGWRRGCSTGEARVIAGGGKETSVQDRRNSGEGPGDWETYQIQ